jgi:hypothetical protein
MKFFLLFSLLISSIGFGQNFTISDQHHYGTSGYDDLQQTIKCQDGGFLSIASSYATDYDKTEGFGGWDIWVVRLNADKTIRWEKTFGGSEDENPMSIVELTNGNILVSAVTWSGISGNKTSVNFGSNDIWILKLDALGTKIWEKEFGSSHGDGGTIYEISPTNYLIFGASDGAVSGTKTVAGYGGLDTWCIGIDSSGAEIWQKAYGGSGADGSNGKGFCKLQNGNVLILSTSDSGISGNKTSPNYGYMDGWLLEINPSNGQLIQQNSFGGYQQDYLFSVFQAGNAIYLTGSSRSGISGNKQSVLYGTTSAWLLKLDGNLSVLSDQSFGGTIACAFGSGFTKTNSGFIVLGLCRNDSNPWVTRAVNGANDIWLMGFDDAGNYQWNYSFGSATGIDEIGDLIENSNNYYTVSFMTNATSINGDMALSGYGSYDLFLVDLNTNLGFSDLSADQFSVYPNPVTNSFSVKGLSEPAHYEIADMQGHIIELGNYNGTIDAVKFNAGMYTIRIASGSQTVIKKWIKN